MKPCYIIIATFWCSSPQNEKSHIGSTKYPSRKVARMPKSEYRKANRFGNKKTQIKRATRTCFCFGRPHPFSLRAALVRLRSLPVPVRGAVAPQDGVLQGGAAAEEAQSGA
jgi:hypothetical protein